MDQTTMRSDFQNRVAGLADDWTDGQIDAYLDAAYQYEIPDQVPGLLTDGDWTASTVASTQDYTYPATVHNVRPGARIDDRALLSYFNPKIMWEFYDRTDTTSESEPYAALFYGTTMTLYPTPDAAYAVWVPARVYPSAGLTDGLTNETHAEAVLAAAARKFALNHGLDEVAGREGQRLGYQTSLLRRRSLSAPRDPTYGVTF